MFYSTSHRFKGGLEQAHPEYKQHRKRGKLYFNWWMSFSSVDTLMISLCVKCYSGATEARWGVNNFNFPTCEQVCAPREEKTKRTTAAWALPPQTRHRWRRPLTDTPDRCNAGVTASKFHACFFSLTATLQRFTPDRDGQVLAIVPPLSLIGKQMWNDSYKIMFCVMNFS